MRANFISARGDANLIINFFWPYLSDNLRIIQNKIRTFWETDIGSYIKDSVR